MLSLINSATFSVGPFQVGGLPAWIMLALWAEGAIRSRRIKPLRGSSASLRPFG